ncbi:MAG: 3-methyl-2-oxobutanoate dehydrogenase subunit beta [Candidatus Atribacteria bacterium]|nr:3-methyl-2-oxobutanoate dehydrogenase subunit beta [Candidatus Atribacteria bacterium]
MKRILMKGNEAIAEAAVRAGCDLYFGYPITPQTEISEYLSSRLPEEGKVFLQAESEIAAIYMVYGAAAVGKRVLTSSSGPGISLKQEGISYLVSAELPAVIVNMSRGGPGLGNIQPSQSDYFQAVKGGGHGDYKTIVLAPDGMLGQMMEPVVFTEPQFDPLPPKDWAVSGKEGRKRRFIICFALDPQELEKVNQALQEKFRAMERNEIRYEIFGDEHPDLLLVGYGTVARILKSVVREGARKGLRLALVRPITLYPFPSAVMKEKAVQAGRVIDVEMNHGQMLEDVRLAVEGRVPVHFYGRSGGMIPTVEDTLQKVMDILSREGVKHENGI